MATQLPTKFQKSPWAQSLAKRADTAAARATALRKSQVSTPRQAGATLVGAFAGGAASRAIPSIGPVPMPALLALCLWGAGAVSGSADLINAGTGNAALVAGAMGDAAAGRALGDE